MLTISGLLAGIAGVLMAGRMYTGQPSAGNGMELDVIAAAVIGRVGFFGGVGCVSGMLMGVIIIGIMYNAMNLLEIASFWQLVVKGLLLIVAVYIDVLRKRRESRI